MPMKISENKYAQTFTYESAQIKLFSRLLEFKLGKLFAKYANTPQYETFYGPILHQIVVVISFISNTAATFASFDCANQKDVLLCRKSFRQKSNCFAV